MPPEKDKKKNSSVLPKFKDIIAFEPSAVKILTEKSEYEMMMKYQPTLEPLQVANRTVKELHRLLYDTETNKPSYTRKTIYIHLNLLEEAGLVKISGQRITEGSRQIEKLYRATGKVFLFKPDFNYAQSYWNSEKGKIEVDIMRVLLTEVLDIPELDTNAFQDYIHDFSIGYWDLYTKFIKKVEINEELQRFFTLKEQGIHSVDYLLDQVILFSIFLKKRELFSKIAKLCNLDV